VLMRDDLRKKYDASIGQMRVPYGTNYSSLGYSSWKGPLRPQALFVDENACIGHFPKQKSAIFVYMHCPIMEYIYIYIYSMGFLYTVQLDC
jgi:hypothetical protein